MPSPDRIQVLILKPVRTLFHFLRPFQQTRVRVVLLGATSVNYPIPTADLQSVQLTRCPMQRLLRCVGRRVTRLRVTEFPKPARGAWTDGVNQPVVMLVCQLGAA